MFFVVIIFMEKSVLVKWKLLWSIRDFKMEPSKKHNLKELYVWCSIRAKYPDAFEQTTNKPCKDMTLTL